MEVLSGINSTLLLHGDFTGGKYQYMFGDKYTSEKTFKQMQADNDEQGIVPLLCSELLAELRSRRTPGNDLNINYSSIDISACETTNTKRVCRDLLNPENPKRCMLDSRQVRGEKRGME